VWRHTEDGEDVQLLSRPLEQWQDVIPTLVTMDLDSPMYKDVMDHVVDHNDRLEAERGVAIREAVGEQTEHLWKLVADRQNGRTTFRALPGSDPARQM
jgi:hypothetical protein